MPTDLGTPEPVDLRTIGSDEARDFTPWLAQVDNLRRLPDALNLCKWLQTWLKAERFQAVAFMFFCHAPVEWQTPTSTQPSFWFKPSWPFPVGCLCLQLVIDLVLEEESQHLAMLGDFMGTPISLQFESSHHQEQHDIILM